MGLCWSQMCGNRSDADHQQQQISPIDLASENVHLITTMQKWEEKLSEASRDGKIVVANFSASWCSPCKVIAPAYIELANKYSHSLIFVKIDVDELPEFSNSWDIKATPSFFFLKDGQKVDNLVGANKQDLQKKIAAFANSGTRSK